MLLLLLLGSCKSSRNSVKVKPDNREAAVTPVPHKLSSSSVDTEIGKRLVSEARKWLGVPYSYGGNSRKGVDCSGMVVAVYRDAASLKLPRSSADQHRYCRDINRKDLEAGDLVFFKGSSKGKISHVGIYIGDNKMIHASSSRGVIVSDLAEKYYVRHYHASGRVEGVTFAATGNSPDKNKKKKQKKSKQTPPPSPVEEKIISPADTIIVRPIVPTGSIQERRNTTPADSIAPADSIISRRNTIAADSTAVDTTAVTDDIRNRVSRGFKGAF